MKIIYRRLLLLLLSACLIIIMPYEGNCTDKTLAEVKKILTNAEPDYYPKNLKIKPIGCIHKDVECIRLFATELIWGNKRSTKRLVLLSCNYIYVGNYSIDDFPTQLKGEKLFFPYDTSDGNVIDFSHGIPPKIYLDGELHTLERKEQKK